MSPIMIGDGHKIEKAKEGDRVVGSFGIHKGREAVITDIGTRAITAVTDDGEEIVFWEYECNLVKKQKVRKGLRSKC